jgi:hypothetical protein
VGIRPTVPSCRWLQEAYRRPLLSQLEFGKPMADTWNVMRYDVHPRDFAKVEAVDEADLSFAAFSLEHAACGDDVLEVRLGEEALLEWCMACAIMMIFRPGEL